MSNASPGSAEARCPTTPYWWCGATRARADTEEAGRFLRRFPDWGRGGISAFYAQTDGEVDALCQTKLTRFPTVLIFQRASLVKAGVDIVGTFRTPHVTLAHEDVEELVRRLVNCEHTERANPYHVPEASGKEVG